MSAVVLLWLVLVGGVVLEVCQSSLRPETDLQSSCYDFPSKEFSSKNSITAKYGITPKVQLTSKSNAIEFTLTTSNGGKASLSQFLKTNPVLLIWGMPTCPAFRGYMGDKRFVGASYIEENSLAEKLSGKVTVLHIISSEPHPTWPFANFDTGNIRVNLWSTIKQPQTFSERFSLSLPPVTSLLSPTIQILVDDLDGNEGNGRNNPVWCSYSHAARGAIFVGQDGVVHITQDWFNGPDMLKEIEAYLQQ